VQAADAPAAQARERMIEMVVVGSALLEALRRLAQQDAAVAYDNSNKSPTAVERGLPTNRPPLA